MKERTSLARWTPRRLLSLLMALIMTLSLLPTAALAASDYSLTVTGFSTGHLIVGQESNEITAKLTSTKSTTESVRLKITVKQRTPTGSISTGDCTIQYIDTTSGTYTAVTATADPATGIISGYLDAGISSLDDSHPVSATFKLKFNKPDQYDYTVMAYSVDTSGNETYLSPTNAGSSIVVKDAIKSVTVDPAEPEAGLPFTVRADTNVNSGYVVFEYNNVPVSAPVNPLLNNKGYAEYKEFTAVATATEVKATLTGAAGIPDATKTAPVNVGTPATYHTVTFHENAAGVYNMPAPLTVEHNGMVAEPITPQRDGYTFDSWYKEPTCTTKWNFTTDAVTDNLELYAKWEKITYPVSFAHLPTGVTVSPAAPSHAAVGDTVTFNVTVSAKYDTANMLVSVGDPGASMLLAPKSQHTNSTSGDTTFYYLFEVKDQMIYRGTGPAGPAAPTILISVNPLTEKTFNVTLPTGEGFDAAFADTSIVNKFTTVDYDGNVSFTVKARPGYTVEGVYANGERLTSTTGTYEIKNIKSNQAVTVDMAAVQFHTVTYVLDGKQMAAQSVANGSNATSLPAPNKTGYDWDTKWYMDEHYNTEFNFATETIIKDTVLYGRYTPIDVTISYDALPGVTTTKTYGLAATLTETIPVNAGHTFLGWSETLGATAASYLPGATFSKEIENPITLHAVWQKNIYTITFSSGEGYTLHSGHGSMTVADGENFDFNLIVDPAYAQNDPEVWTNTTGVGTGSKLTNPTPYTDPVDGSKQYHYTLTNVKADTAVNVKVTANATYTVTFMTNGTVYQTQQVEFNHKATQPVDPKVEGYTFDGWYKETTFTTPWNFATPITDNTTLHAKLDPIIPEITWPTTTTGYEFKFTAPAGLVGNTSGTGTVAYNDVVTFTITIGKGYDASKMQVGINGVLLSPKEINGDDYIFEFTAKEDTEITVVGVARKTVTIIYNDNGGYGGPVQETVNYYLDGGPGNGKISKTAPKREGYDFLGWAKTNNALAPAYSNPAAPTTTDVADFTSDTVLYAVWKAKETGITLVVDKTEQYEGEDVTLTATITSSGSGASVTTGSVQFYRCTDADPTATTATWTLLDSKVVSGGTAIYKAETSGFKYGDTNKDTYKAVFIPTEGNGYTEITSATEAVTVKSTAISWKLDTTDPTAPKIDTDADANVLIITDKTGATVTAMVAGQVYTLKLPAIYALDDLGTQLTVNKDYSVTWQYRNDKGVWTDYTNSGSGDTTTVDAAYSQYVFRAVVTPVTGATSHFTKAAKYTTDDALDKDKYETALISASTTEVDLQSTTTALAITGADDEENDVYINGTQPFNATVGSHLAQFEGKKVTLTATVTDDNTTKGVTTGFVDFYRKGAAADTLLNASPIAVGTNGVATCEVTISNWDTTQTAANNKDEFYAVYLANDTYNTSASWTAAAGELKAVYIKSTEIAQPVLKSDLTGKRGGAVANTTAGDDLTELLAGVQHTFSLVETGAQTKVEGVDGQFSVVAKDGRTVAAKNYTIQWITKTGDNEIVSSVTGSEFKTSDNKVGDEIYVRLNPTGDMKTGADSKKAIIGKKQDVTVTVEASDEIASTPVDRAAKKFPDVYQLNEIELTATVKGYDSETMTPTGTVKFYYKDRQVTPNTFVYLGEAALEKGTDGKMHASFKTDKLPVDKDNNTKLDVVVCAAYFGDDTFAASKNVSATTGNIASAGSPSYVTYDTVTVYSSVVFAGDSENKATTTPGTDGITITANGKLKANESSVTLTLGQVYTLDHGNATVGSVDLSKLTYNTDYTVQWQILENALQHQDSGSTGSYAATDKWKDLSGETGTSYTGMMEQDAAYRAKITVKDTPIAKGSFTKVDQAIKGRDVYYSNVLVVGVGMATVTTNITTSANQNFNEEGIVSGETATIHVLASGAAKTTPISTVTATITNGASETVFNEKANNVNGYTSFAWDTSGLTPGYYTLTVTAESNNGYAPQTITRTLIVRDNAYTLKATKESKVYNGKAQGIDWELTGVDIENALAQKSVVVYYYDKDGKMVEPTQAGKYQYDLYLPASAYWTELTHITGTFTIEKRPVEVVDLVAQAKVYDGTPNANIQEIILHDAKVDLTTGLPNEDIGIIDGDSVYAVGTGYTSKDTAGTAKLGVKDVILKGDDAANYTLSASGYTEDFNIQRSQVKGAIVSGRTYKYTGKDIKLAASDIYLIDQAGSQLTDYDVTYYYHNGDGVEKVDAMNKMGKYTVIARPEQTNYKGGATETVYVGTADNAGTLDKSAVSSLITISNTVELYGATTSVKAEATNNATVTVEYQDGTGWSATRPTDAGRYLVKVTTSTGDTAYGLYTVVKARPALMLTATGATYNSAQYNGTPNGTYNNDPALPADTYYTYTGGTIQGVAYEAPTEAGDYVVTAHVGKTPNYTAHEISTNFTIAKAPLTIKADDLQRWQYGAYPDMVATYTGLATEGVAADTSLRDVQIQPEFLFNEKDGGYTNHAFDQVGTYPVTVRNALARNYTVTYKDGKIATTEKEPKAELAIHGMPDNGTTTTENLVYYGDTIQLYAYGYYKTIDSNNSSGSYNTSSLIEWAVSPSAPASIDNSGLLKINGVGTFKVTLTRGSGSAAISTDINVTAEKQEVKVVIPAEDKVYDGNAQTYTTANGYAVNGKFENVTSDFNYNNTTRTNVGSQIVTGKVLLSDPNYVSETYGGLFTINVKDVRVTPKEISVIYGEALGTLDYSEPDIIAGIPALTDGKAVSERKDYKNLDVLDGYEILVAGRENENYNVKYVTDQTAPDVEVTPKVLTIKTGTLKEQIGMTSGSLNPKGKYPVNGAAVNSAIAMEPSNVRMYGEPNWVMDEVMDETLATLIGGDTLADLTALNDKLVSFNYNIGADANITYLTRNDAAPAAVDSRAKYDVVTNPTMMDFKNYNETYTLGTQNIYQRPVTLKLREGLANLTAYKPTILDASDNVKTDVLLDLLLNNLEVKKYNNGTLEEGGLAELLKHTINDLDIKIVSATYISATKTISVIIELGNKNYWTENLNFTVTVDPTKIVAKYGPLGWTSASVTMYSVEESAPSVPVDVSGKVWYEIYVKNPSITDPKYSDYKGTPYVHRVPMIKGSSTGVYIANYPSLPAGEYVMFAIAEEYTIIE